MRFRIFHSHLRGFSEYEFKIILYLFHLLQKLYIALVKKGRVTLRSPQDAVAIHGQPNDGVVGHCRSPFHFEWPLQFISFKNGLLVYLKMSLINGFLV